MQINLCSGCMRSVDDYPCPHCGFDPGVQPQPEFALPYEYILHGRYLIGRVLGQGGFGLTYVGWDLALDMKVAIKEFYPSGHAMRNRTMGLSLCWSSTDQAKNLRMSGMETFLKEAKKMARTDGIAAVVRVRDTFADNETAYIVMDFVEGETLKKRLERTGPMSWTEAKPLFTQAISAMTEVHRAGIIHRDLSPDNLMLLPGGEIRILDLGAAKDLNVNSGVSSMQVIKGGFSPIEQYSQSGSSGPWTDVYAMAATIYYTLTGTLPPPAVDRMAGDSLRWDLPQLKALSKPVLTALEKALTVTPQERTQSMEQFLTQIQAGAEKPPKPPKEPKPPKPPKEPKPPKKDLTQGSVTGTMLLFALPMILGNLLQQCYNIADTLIVGHFLGPAALAAAGSAYTLMTFLTSILIGLCMGSGSVFSMYFGRKDLAGMQGSMRSSFLLIGAVTVGMNVLVLLMLDEILRLLQVPADVYPLMRAYVKIVFCGIFFVFLYNYFSFALKSVGNSVTPLYFLGASAVLNIGLDLLFVTVLHRGIAGAAEATVIAQIFSGLGLGLYTWVKEPALRLSRKGQGNGREILRFSLAACIQQSVMNFGILMIQGLVNSFGTAVMAAFAAAVKIDSFAYMPAQEFGNAFSIFTSQNHGAGAKDRVKAGTRSAVQLSMAFCLVISALVWVTAPWLMAIFIDVSEREIISIGVKYLHIEGAFYFGIGVLFLLYGYFRGVARPEMSIVLTVISLGTRVLLAYTLAPTFGVEAIWWAIPIGWILADSVGLACMRKKAQ